jgi:hypothetical protein
MRWFFPLLLSAAAVTSPAHATWSIILIDTRTGEIAVGSATCLTGFDLRANTPVLIPGVGAATAQSFVDTTGQNRVFIRDRLALGFAPPAIITQLASFDTGHQTRQYGIGDAFGRVATFSGTGAGAYAGGQIGSFTSTQSGQVGTIAYAIQGNVLTGSPVITQAVQAAIATPGDLPAKLMASMQAARLMGGDGRCSCSSGNPTGCGSPPPAFTKSAHIAYMLIARAGDTEGSNGIYRAGTSPFALIAADVNGDQRPDLLTANFSSTASVITNLSGPSLPLAPIFTPLPTNYPIAAGARGLALADINADLIPDLISANSSVNSLTILRGTAAGAFTPAGSVPVGTSPRQVVAADFDGNNGPDLAAVNFTTNNVSILLNDGAGAFTPAASPLVDAGPVDLAAANLVGSAAIDLAVVSRTTNRLSILRGNADGTFTPDISFDTTAGPTSIITRDLDGDGDADIALCTDTARTIHLFRNDAGEFTPLVYTLTFPAADVATDDLNGDQRLDLVAVGASSFATFFNSGPTGEAAFTLDRVYTTVGGLNSVSLADLDSDGDPDASLIASSTGSVITIKNLGPGPLRGKFNDGLGCATGNYFMNFNVAFTSAPDPDPVLTLQSRYDQWRTDLIGNPDAVQSIAAFDPPRLPATGVPATSTLTISLRTWQKNPALMPGNLIITEVIPQGGSPTTSIGPVEPQGGGVYRALITRTGSTSGLVRFRARFDDPFRPITLMPEPALSIYPGPCYANCDGSTSPPFLNANDFICFLQKFAANDPYANCDVVGPLTASDYICFINSYAMGCP